MDFDEIKGRVQSFTKKYRELGFEIEEHYREYAYLVHVRKDQNKVTIRDGFFSETEFNKSAVKLTSFEVFFTVGDMRFAHYVSDYPIDEYIERFILLEDMIEKFFRKQYTISNDRYFIFWEKHYMNINLGDELYHLIQVK